MALATADYAGNQLITYFNRLASRIRLNVFTEVNDFTRAFVPKRYGNNPKRVGFPFVHVRTAYAATLDFYEDIVVRQCGNGVRDYAAILPSGYLDATYDDFYSMVASSQEWQDKLAELAVMMVQEYDVDGIFFDSYGCHFNQLFATAESQEFVAIQEYNAQMVVMMERIRTAIRRIKPDAVVLAETGSGQCLSVTDGGWTADFAWFKLNSAGTVLESPLKYAQPQSNLFSNGSTMSELRQVFAAGYGLCVCDFNVWEANIEEIRTLVELRKTYADAFVYGTVPFAPDVSEAGVGSSYFQGTGNGILTVINTNTDDVSVVISLGKEFAGVNFEDLLSGVQYTADRNGDIAVDLDAEALLVLLKK